MNFMPLEAVWADARLDTSRLRPRSEVVSGYSRFRPGDVLCPKVAPTFQAGRSAVISDIPSECGAATTEVFVLRPRRDVDSRFIRYTLLSSRFLSESVTHFQGVAGLQRVPGEYIASFPIAAVEPEEQRRIADFLDDQVSVLDEALAQARAVLPLLEQRALASREAVLIDLRRTAAAIPLRWVLQEIDDRLGGRSPLPLLSVSIRGGVQQRRALTEDLPRAEDHSNYKVARRGDIVLNRMRAFQGAIGMAPCDGLVSPDYAVLRVLEPHRAEYVSAVVRTSWFTSEMTRRLRGIGSVDQGNVRTPRVNVDDLNDIRLPLPRSLDQERWSVRLAAGDPAEGRSAALSVMSLLEERRRALITACVTGEFDVSTASTRAGDAALRSLP